MMARALIIPRYGAAAAPARFPFNHRTMAEVNAADPAAWRAANAPHFDAVYGPELRHSDCLGRQNCRTFGVAERLAAAREWRLANKARFDAIYGPETACACGAS